MGYKKGEVLKTAFDTYTISGQRGAGGSGEVYEALDSEGVAYAVKILDPKMTNSTRLKRFKNEIHFCAKNVHPNIIQVNGSGITGSGSTFYVMPLYTCTLRDLISKGIARADVLQYFGHVLDGVEAAHLKGVWHRDLKPENILFSEATRVLVVADFGIAHFEEEELLTAVETRNDERLGNFLYAAPEQRMRGRSVDSKADIYALGLILNEMFSGAVPLGTSFRKVREVDPDYAYLDGLIESMLHQEPGPRPSVSDVKRELIARGNEFLSVQRVSKLTSEIIPETEVDDPIVKRPIELVDTDYQDGCLVFRFSALPPSAWIAAFQNPKRQHEFFEGAGPGFFTFDGSEARVILRDGMSAPKLQRYTRSYINLANQQYAETVIAERQRRLEEVRETRRRAIAEEERRQEIRRQLNS